MLFAARCSLFVVCCCLTFLLVPCCVLCVCLLLVACCSACVVRCLLFVVSGLWLIFFGGRCLLHVVRCVVAIVGHLLLLDCFSLCVACCVENCKL